MLAYQVENNESQMMGIKKKEYLRVLSNIVKESREAQVRRWGTTDSRDSYVAVLNPNIKAPP